jgi:hypothetical protein
MYATPLVITHDVPYVVAGARTGIASSAEYANDEAAGYPSIVSAGIGARKATSTAVTGSR